MSDPARYTIGWICALEVEYLAARQFLDKEHDQPLTRAAKDENAYTLGEMKGHNIVIACLPENEYGISPATRLVSDMRNTFFNIEKGLMVGIGGGAPYGDRDIRLGDVVVSSLINGKSSVLQYDFGKRDQAGEREFQFTAYFDKPPLQSAVRSIRVKSHEPGRHLANTVERAFRNKPILQKLSSPGIGKDVLYKSDVIHPQDGKDCFRTCHNPRNIVDRPRREKNPVVHYGRIASANTVMKDAKMRDRLAREEDILCFEMEGAGLVNHFPCLIIRGICDYADSHKNKDWQGYAAVTAAAYASDLLGELARTEPAKQGKAMGTEFLSDVQRDVNTMTSDLGKITGQLDKKEQTTILEWITETNYADQQNDYLNRREEDTGTWFLGSDQYQNWCQRSDQTLYCEGIPGTGKTILVATVVDDLLRQFHSGQETGVGIVYIYIDSQRQKDQQLQALFANVLKQLCRNRPLPNEVITLYQNNKRMDSFPTVKDLLAAIESILVRFSKLFFVVDALDEFFVEKDLHFFIAKLLAFRLKCPTNILTTSRPNTTIPRILPNGTVTKEIRANQGDIEKYINRQISILPRFASRNEGLRDYITAEVLQAVDGMFLLAHIYMNALAGAHSRKAFFRALQGFRETTKADVYACAYDSAMERIEANTLTRDLAMRVLLWVSRTRRPMRMKDLKHALAVEIGTKAFSRDDMPEIDLVSICAGLIMIEKRWHRDKREVEYVRLVHSTTQDYFNETWWTWFPDADAHMAQVCITYLSYDTFATGPCETSTELFARLDKNSFYRYAALCWFEYVRNIMEDDGMVLEFLSNESVIRSCSQAMIFCRFGFSYLGSLPNWLKRNEPHGLMNGLTLASVLGLEVAVKALIARGAKIDGKDGWHRTPLAWAAWRGNGDMVKLLLDGGAHVDSNPYPTPLTLAAERGHTEIVQLLLSKGASLKPLNRPQPLFAAVDRGKEEVVSLLLENGADIESRDEGGLRPLTRAISMGQTRVVELLLERGACIEFHDCKNATPLSWAISVASVYPAILKMLLARGVNVETRSGDKMQTPLCVAVRFNRIEAVKLLLEAGASLQEKDYMFHGTPLHWAVYYEGRERMMKYLIEKGANLEVRGYEGKTPLCLAIKHGKKAAVEILLASGAYVETRDDKFGRTPCLWAARDNRGEILSVLVEKGANLNAKDKRGKTAISLAVKHGSDTVLPILWKELGDELLWKKRYDDALRDARREARRESVKRETREKKGIQNMLKEVEMQDAPGERVLPNSECEVVMEDAPGEPVQS